ncbi:hypothetical protein RND81_12G096700 [Saponaria officinalis]|uniref:SS18 N-terminal domain-containing protein n=1 Tax=Saponaria officinalis TaxID=3572 RepID=A0AAW1H8L3_SAPOF
MQQQQSSQMFGMPSQQPTTLISTEQIQKYLDENKQLIMAIMESQNLGKINECAQYQAQLQKNLMYLAAIADAQPPPPTGPSQPPPQQQPQLQPQPQTPMQPAIPQGPPMQSPQLAFNQNQQQQQQLLLLQQQQHQQQQQTVGYGPRMGFMGQAYDQQSHPIQQHQQTMAGMMGLRMGGASGLHPAVQTGHGGVTHFMDARTRQEGPESGTGDGHGK